MGAASPTTTTATQAITLPTDARASTRKPRKSFRERFVRIVKFAKTADVVRRMRALPSARYHLNAVAATLCAFFPRRRLLARVSILHTSTDTHTHTHTPSSPPTSRSTSPTSTRNRKAPLSHLSVLSPSRPPLFHAPVAGFFADGPFGFFFF